MSVNSDLLSQKNKFGNKHYEDEIGRDGSLTNKMQVNSDTNIIPVSEHMNKIRALQQRLEDSTVQFSACRQEISRLNNELTVAKSETKSRQEEKMAIEQVLEVAHK